MFFFEPQWDDIRIVVLVSLVISILLFFLISKFTNRFQCSNWIIFVPTFISALGAIIGIMLMIYYEGKDSVLQYSFLGFFSYALSTFIITTVISLIVLKFKK